LPTRAQGTLFGHAIHTLLTALLLAAVPVGPADARAISAKRVLLIYSHERELGMYAGFDRAIRTRLQAGTATPIEFYTEYLDLMRFGDSAHRQTAIDYLHVKYASPQIDLIVASGSLAFDFLMENDDAIFPGVPVVFASVNASRMTELHTNMTGIAVKRDVRQTLDLLLTLQPDTQHIVIPVGSSPTEQAWTEDTRNLLRPYEARVGLTYLSGLSMDAMIRELHDLPAHSAILFTTLFYYDAAGQYFLPEETAAAIAAQANAPVYSTDEAFLGSGIVGGMLYDLGPSGDAAGRLGQRVLAGERPNNIPIETIDPNHPMFDARQLQHWHVAKSRLPSGSVVLFDEIGPWERYKMYIVGALSLLTFQAALIAGLVVSRARQRQAEASLLASHGQIRDLAGRLIVAQEEERTRIARELHDDAGQRMASLSIALSRIRRKVVDDAPQATEALGEVQNEMATLSNDLRELSHTLHPGALEHVGLVKSLEIRCNEVQVESGIAVRYDVGPGVGELPSAVALCLYRVAQEALRNVVKHADARSARVSLIRRDGHITMEVEDDGRGFEAGTTDGQRGLGLMSLDERVRMLDGTMSITTARRAGTTLAVTIPVPERHDA
jgi:signal transduction histidine kinase/ABC-type uncharacterized transport system substrate-binding protein